MSYRLETHEWAIIGYCFGVFVYWATDQFGEPSPQVHEQQVTLGERELSRLEGGETVIIRRWHGAQLALSGDEVLPGEVIDADAADEIED